MNYLLAIDSGTSSTRAMLYDQNGKLLSSSQQDLTQYYPKPGWVEHDPEEIWEKTLTAMNDVLQGIDKQKILAAGITNQRETTVVWDRQTGKCLHNAIVWQDRRTQSICDSFQEDAHWIQKKTGLRPDPYFSASKLSWLLNSIPEARGLADMGRLAFGTIDSFLIWRLSNGKVHVTDVTNASRTLLYNIFDLKWDDELLARFEIPESVLPEVLDSAANFGAIDKVHLGVEIPITGVAGDQHAALVGQQCFEKGMIKATFGTGGFLLINTGSAPILSSHGLLTTIAYKVSDEVIYGIEGSIYQAGTTVKWLRDELKIINTAEETEALAASLPDNGGVYFIPSFTGMGAPHWLKTNGAILCGINRDTKPAHFARAALESVCYQTRDVVTCMLEDTHLEMNILRVDGGMSNNQWFLKQLASQTSLMVQKPDDIETTALGAAMLAALGIGLTDNFSGFSAWLKHELVYSPENEQARIQKDYEGWLKSLDFLKMQSQIEQ